jgi:succinate dehydrogenase flavin-adding protein (antitoxin of CptAB toxin-antitoxin module)
MCESLPEHFATEEMGESISPAKKKSLIKSGEIYLTTLASNLLEFFKKCRKLEEGMDAKEVLDSVFPSIDDDAKDYYRAILNRSDVRKMIKSVTRKDEIFMKLVTLKDYKSIRFQLIDFIVNKFCNQKLDEIRTDENEKYIFHILYNLGNYTEKGFKILERKKEQIFRLLESCELDFGTNDHKFAFIHNI